MSDAIKWALLIAGAIVIIGLIVSLPFMEFLNVDEFASLITELVDIARTGLVFGRSTVNLFLTNFGRTALTGLLYWMFGKWAITIAVKIVVWAYHFIFK